MNFQRCCDVLELTPPITLPGLRAAYKDLVQVWHPDRFSHNARLQERAQEKIKVINLAYETLEQFLLDQEARAVAARAKSMPTAASDSASSTAAKSSQQSPHRSATPDTNFAWQVASAYHRAMNNAQGKRGLFGWFSRLSLTNQARVYGILVGPVVIVGVWLMLLLASLLSAYPMLVLGLCSAIAIYVLLRKLSDYSAR